MRLHKDKDLCLFSSLMDPKYPELCQVPGQPQYIFIKWADERKFLDRRGHVFFYIQLYKHP